MLLKTLFYRVSTVSAKNSSSFNIFSAPAIVFITCQNCHHMKNNMPYKGNVVLDGLSVLNHLISTKCKKVQLSLVVVEGSGRQILQRLFIFFIDMFLEDFLVIFITV